MAISTGDIIRAFPRLLWNGLSDVGNLFHIEILNDNAGAFQDIIDDLRALFDVWYGYINAAIPNSTEYADINFFNETQNEPYGSYDWPLADTGDSPTESYAPGVAAFVWFPTGQSQVFGRKWFGPFNEGSIAAGVLNPTLVGLLSDLGDGMLEDPITLSVSGATVRYVVRHAREDGSEIDPPMYLPAVQYNIAGDVGYQRRRRPGVGS